MYMENTMSVMTSKSASDVVELARLACEQDPHWIDFFRQVLGDDGIVQSAYPVHEDRKIFETTPEYADIMLMLAQLRAREPVGTDPEKVITVRLPSTLHQWLRNRAHQEQTSMNKLCISLLMQPIDSDLVLSDDDEGTPVG
jgi:predicted HicB family RNase H-like nuclease